MLNEIPINQLQNLVPNLVFKTFITKGGQKLVYEAEYNGNKIAAKILMPPNTRAVARAKRELELLRNLQTPDVVDLVDYFEVQISDRLGLIVLEEFIVGKTLEEVILEGSVSKELVVIVAEKILDILSELESKRVVHRDIKPNNIMISEDNKVTLLDFGIARALDDASITSDFALQAPCTLAYASPEQLTNNKTSQDTRTDFFSLGLVLFQMRTGLHPFKGNDDSDDFDFANAIMEDTRYKILDFVDTTPFDIKLDEIYLKLSAHEPYKRYRRVDFVKPDIEKLRSLI